MSLFRRTAPHPNPLPQGERGHVALANTHSATGTAPPSPPEGEGWGGGALTRRWLILAPFALAACGFTPAYAPGGGGDRLLGTVWAQDPTTKNGFDLVQRLEERLGRPKNTRYDLTYTIVTETVGVGITADSQITRYNLKGVVDYTLTDRSSGVRVAGGRVQSFTAFSATGSTVAGLAAEEDAALRLMRILADQIVARLIAASANLP
jgi:LPS-assembly lipoprotein